VTIGRSPRRMLLFVSVALIGAAAAAGPVLYSPEPATACHDIVLGSNVLHTAGPGYDLTTVSAHRTSPS
jgi:hypothetical protein